MTINALLGWLVAASWKATLVIGLLVLVRTLLRGWLPAAWRHALWSLVALRLLLPVGPASPFSLFRLLGLGGGGSGRLLPGLGDLADAAAGGAGEAAAPASATVPGFGLFEAAALLWGLGILALAVRAAVAHRRQGAALAAARRVTDPAVLAVLADCRRSLGVRGAVDLLASDAVASPAVAAAILGGGRAGRPAGRILLPTGLLAGLNERELRHVLLHELAHLRRHDGLSQLLGRLLVTVHWFNPAVHYARRRMQADCELAADALALAHLGAGERASYGRTLLQMLTPARRVAALPGLLAMTTSRRQLRRRITMIASFRPATRRRLPALAALAAGLALVALTDVHGLAAAAPAPPTAEDGANLKATVDAVRSTGVAMFALLTDQTATGSGESAGEENGPFVEPLSGHLLRQAEPAPGAEVHRRGAEGRRLGPSAGVLPEDRRRPRRPLPARRPQRRPRRQVRGRRLSGRPLPAGRHRPRRGLDGRLLHRLAGAAGERPLKIRLDVCTGARC